MVNGPGVMDIEEMQAKIKELEERLDSLSRTLDLLQEVIGIEMVITPRQVAHEGQCEKCDRVRLLNSGNICQGCFYEEIGVDEYPRL